MTKSNNKIGRQIELIRLARGMAQADLGEAVGVSQAMISNFENGRKPIPDDVLTRIKSALNWSPEAEKAVETLAGG